MELPKKVYRVLVHTGNLLYESDGQLLRGGCFGTRYVEASDDKEAASKAVEIVKNDARLRELAKNEVDTPPLVEASEVNQIDPDERQPMLESGYTFYAEKPGKDLKRPKGLFGFLRTLGRE